jgi:hypothetical protein
MVDTAAPARGETAGLYRCLAPQLGPSRTASERTFEQCSPSLRRPQRQRPAPLASRSHINHPPVRGKKDKQARKEHLIRLLAGARSWGPIRVCALLGGGR